MKIKLNVMADDGLANDVESSGDSSSSTITSSLDYEAEDELDDKTNEMKPFKNDHLKHVQNFLKIFENPSTTNKFKPITSVLNKNTSTPITAANETIALAGCYKTPLTMKEQQSAFSLAAYSKENVMGKNRQASLLTRIDIIDLTDVSTTTEATNIDSKPIILTSTPTTNKIKATTRETAKPPKFQISTKFMRKRRRHKFYNRTPDTTTSSTNNTNNNSSSEEMLIKPSTTNTLIFQSNEAVQAEQHGHLSSLEDSNAKFKDFSIETLLNK